MGGDERREDQGRGIIPMMALGNLEKRMGSGGMAMLDSLAWSR